MVGSLFGMYRPTPIPSSTYRDESERFMALEARIDTLELACAGLWELLKEKNGFSDEQIGQYIHAIDMRDGQADGKAHPQEALCPKCGRKLLTRSRKRCVWCGADLVAAPFSTTS